MPPDLPVTVCMLQAPSVAALSSSSPLHLPHRLSLLPLATCSPRLQGFVPITLSGQRDRIVGCFFIGDGTDMLASVCHDGAVHVYKWVQQEDLDEEEKAFKQRRMNAPGDGHASDGQWVLEGRHHIQIDHCKIVSAAINRKNRCPPLAWGGGVWRGAVRSGARPSGEPGGSRWGGPSV